MQTKFLLLWLHFTDTHRPFSSLCVVMLEWTGINVLFHQIDKEEMQERRPRRVRLPDEQRLMHRILNNYDTAARPVFNASHTVTVKFGYTLTQIADMVYKTQLSDCCVKFKVLAGIPSISEFYLFGWRSCGESLEVSCISGRFGLLCVFLFCACFPLLLLKYLEFPKSHSCCVRALLQRHTHTFPLGLKWALPRAKNVMEWTLERFSPELCQCENIHLLENAFCQF